MSKRKECVENIVLEVKLKDIFEKFKLNFGNEILEVGKNKKEKWFWYGSKDAGIYFEIKGENDLKNKVYNIEQLKAQLLPKGSVCPICKKII